MRALACLAVLALAAPAFAAEKTKGGVPVDNLTPSGMTRLSVTVPAKPGLPARLVYGAPDQKVGAAGTVVNPLHNPRLLHRVEIQGGVLADEALRLLRRFFDDRR